MTAPIVATKRKLPTLRRAAAPAPKSRPAPTPGPAPAARTARPPRNALVPTLRSLPEDLVLAPQAEVPRMPAGRDTSRAPGAGNVRELTWAEFDRYVTALARDIQKGLGRARPEAVVGVAHGGVFVGGAVSRALGVEFFPVRISRRSRDKRVGPTLSGTMPRELKGKRVLVVDDVASSGDTLELAAQLARKVGATRVETCTLVRRPDGYVPGFSAISTDALVVFPWDYEAVTEEGRFESGSHDIDPDTAGA